MSKNLFKIFKNYIDKYGNYILIFTFIIFMFITFIGIICHQPWFDESHAWLIAKNLNFSQLIRYLPYEGHLFIWYLLLFPFAKLNIGYPYSMQIINLLCIWGAVFVLFKKAPFHPLVKILIAFSCPMIFTWAVYARCYACGVLLLFLLIAYFKDKLNHPYIYAFLIFLCANTSIMALFGAGAFGILFFYDYIKQYPKFYKSKQFYCLGIFALLTILFVCIQLLGQIHSQLSILESADILKLNHLQVFFLTIAIGLKGIHYSIHHFPQYKDIFIVILYLCLSVLLFKKSRKYLFLWGFTFIGLATVFVAFYNGYSHHHYFYYIYFIICLWGYRLDNKFVTNNTYILSLGFLVFCSICLLVKGYNLYINNITFENINTKQMAQILANSSYIRKENLVICDERTYNIVPYLDKYGVKIYNCTDKKENSFYDRSSNMSLRINPQSLTPENFMKFENKDIYLVATNKAPSKFYSKYYKLKIEYCNPFSNYGDDDPQYCIIKLIPRYK